MRKLLIGLLVLVLLLVGADFALRFIATKKVGEAVAARLGLSTAPDVTIAGFPFVTQAINGEYNTVSAVLPPTSFGKVANVSVSVDLLGVRIPLSDALAGRTDALTAAGGQVRISVPVAAIAAAVGLPNLQVARDGDGLRLSTVVDVLGQQVPIAASLDASIADSTIRLRSRDVSGAGISLDSKVVQAIGTVLDLDLPLTNLPFTITSGTFSILNSDLLVDASTSGLSLANR